MSVNVKERDNRHMNILLFPDGQYAELSHDDKAVNLSMPQNRWHCLLNHLEITAHNVVPSMLTNESIPSHCGDTQRSNLDEVTWLHNDTHGKSYASLSLPVIIHFQKNLLEQSMNTFAAQYKRMQQNYIENGKMMKLDAGFMRNECKPV